MAIALSRGGGKHPKALGHSTRKIWSEVWDFNKPIFEKVMDRGETIHLENQLFRISRHGYMEDAYFTLSYSPIRTEERKIGGTLVTLLETTQAAQETLRLLETVREEKDRLASLIGSISDEVWFADMEKRFTLANPSARREFGMRTMTILKLRSLPLRWNVQSRWHASCRRGCASIAWAPGGSRYEPGGDHKVSRDW